MPLTDSQIKRLKPSDTCTPSRPDKYSDGNNLRLWVRSTGSKVWVSDYKYAAKRQSLTIGKYPAMSLADARQRNQQIKDLIAQGINPKHDKKRLQADTDGTKAFDAIAERWHDDRKAHHDRRLSRRPGRNRPRHLQCAARHHRPTPARR